jgi:hypothetical protein
LALLKKGIDFRFKKVWLVAILLLPLVIFVGGTLFSALTGATKLDFSGKNNPPYAIIAFFCHSSHRRPLAGGVWLARVRPAPPAIPLKCPGFQLDPGIFLVAMAFAARLYPRQVYDG